MIVHAKSAATDVFLEGGTFLTQGLCLTKPLSFEHCIVAFIITHGRYCGIFFDCSQLQVRRSLCPRYYSGYRIDRSCVSCDGCLRFPVACGTCSCVFFAGRVYAYFRDEIFLENIIGKTKSGRWEVVIDIVGWEIAGLLRLPSRIFVYRRVLTVTLARTDIFLRRRLGPYKTPVWLWRGADLARQAAPCQFRLGIIRLWKGTGAIGGGSTYSISRCCSCSDSCWRHDDCCG